MVVDQSIASPVASNGAATTSPATGTTRATSAVTLNGNATAPHAVKELQISTTANTRGPYSRPIGSEVMSLRCIALPPQNTPILSVNRARGGQFPAATEATDQLSLERYLPAEQAAHPPPGRAGRRAGGRDRGANQGRGAGESGRGAAAGRRADGEGGVTSGVQTRLEGTTLDVDAVHAQQPGHRSQRAAVNELAIVLVGADVAILAERATHIARGEENSAGAPCAAIDQLLARMVEPSRDARPRPELAGAELGLAAAAPETDLWLELERLTPVFLERRTRSATTACRAVWSRQYETWPAGGLPRPRGTSQGAAGSRGPSTPAEDRARSSRG